MIKVGDYITAPAGASMFEPGMTIEIFSPGKPFPRWLYRPPFQDGDVRFVRWLYWIFGWNPKSPVKVKISSVDPSTNTLWFEERV